MPAAWCTSVQPSRLATSSLTQSGGFCITLTAICVGGHEQTEEEVRAAVVEADTFSLASHQFWGTWSLFQARVGFPSHLFLRVNTCRPLSMAPLTSLCVCTPRLCFKFTMCPPPSPIPFRNHRAGNFNSLLMGVSTGGCNALTCTYQQCCSL